MPGRAGNDENAVGFADRGNMVNLSFIISIIG